MTTQPQTFHKVLPPTGNPEAPLEREIAPSSTSSAETILRAFLADHDGLEYLRPHLRILIDLTVRTERMAAATRAYKAAKAYGAHRIAERVEQAVLHGEQL